MLTSGEVAGLPEIHDPLELMITLIKSALAGT